MYLPHISELIFHGVLLNADLWILEDFSTYDDIKKGERLEGINY